MWRFSMARVWIFCAALATANFSRYAAGGSDHGGWGLGCRVIWAHVGRPLAQLCFWSPGVGCCTRLRPAKFFMMKLWKNAIAVRTDVTTICMMNST